MPDGAQPHLDRILDGVSAAPAGQARLRRPSASRRGVWFGGFVAASLLAHAAVAGVLMLEREAPTPLPVVTVELDLRAPGVAGRSAPLPRVAKAGLATRKAAAGRTVAEKRKRPPRTRPTPEGQVLGKAKSPTPPTNLAARKLPVATRKPIPPAAPPRPAARLQRAVARRPVLLRPALPVPPVSRREIARFRKTLRKPPEQWRRKAPKRVRTVRRPQAKRTRRNSRSAIKPTRDVAARPTTAAPAGAVVPPRPAGGFGGNPTPHYPREARDNGWEGRVLLLVRVAADGRTAGVSISRSSGFGVLDDSALRTVRRWRFRPATRGGVAVPASVLIPIRFRLRR